MNKILFLTVILLVTSFNAFAYTIEMKTTYSNTRISTAYSFNPIMLASFGKTLVGSKYGVIAHVDGNGLLTPSYDAVFYPTVGKFIKQDKELYYQMDETSSELVLLARKGFLGRWVPVEGVEIQSDLIVRGSVYHAQVLVHID